MKIVYIIVVIFEDDLGPLNPVGPGAAAPPAPMVVTPLPSYHRTFSMKRLNQLVLNLKLIPSKLRKKCS